MGGWDSGVPPVARFHSFRPVGSDSRWFICAMMRAITSLNSAAVTPRACLLFFLTCRQAGGGRPALAIPEDWRQRCSRVGLSRCPEKGVDSNEYVYVEYDCGCVGLKQLRTLRRRGEAALTCPEHGSGKRQPSELLLRVRAALLAACPELGPVVLEAHLLPKLQHPFDMWFPKWQIAAEVDGKQHFTGRMHGRTAAEQQKLDRRVNARCESQRLRLLRFHYADDTQWGKLLLQAVQSVKENPYCWFLRRTRSYNSEPLAL